MKLKVSGLAAMLLAFSCSVSAVAEETTAALIAAGERAAKAGRWSEAKDTFAAVLAKEPANATALYDFGLVLAHLGDLEQAAQLEQRAIQADKTCSPAYLELAFILSKRDQFVEAERVLAEVLKLDPGNKAALKSHSTVKARLKNMAALQAIAAKDEEPKVVAAEVLAKVAGDSEATKALIARGALAFRQGKLAVAERLFQQALGSSPDSVAARAALGVVLGSKGDIAGQLREEGRALALDANNAPA